MPEVVHAEFGTPRALPRTVPVDTEPTVLQPTRHGPLDPSPEPFIHGHYPLSVFGFGAVDHNGELVGVQVPLPNSEIFLRPYTPSTAIAT